MYYLYCTTCTRCTACTVLPVLPVLYYLPVLVLVLPVPVPVLLFVRLVVFPSMSQVGTLLSTSSSHLVPIRRVQTPRARRKDLP
eukprot:SAG11_NODE_35021_length_268_cov_16.082840_1_plen_83_part_10